VPVPTIASFDDFNKSLWEWCEKDAQRPHYKKKRLIEELWEEDIKLNTKRHNINRSTNAKITEKCRQMSFFSI
ncbi:MAG: IS21 family transposase, partial [Clostridia bacterium]|nr:IS21 family transposase [Clostridia bacterium]